MDDPRITTEANDEADRPVLSREEREERDYQRRRSFRGTDYQKDREHLNLLSIFYFVLGGMQCLGVVAGLLYMVLGIAMVSGGMGSGPGAPPPGLGWVMFGAGGVGSLLGGAQVICAALTGIYLRKRTHRTFCFVIACIICIHVPLGTILGVFTILVLQRESVKELFQNGDQAPRFADERDDDDDAYRS